MSWRSTRSTGAEMMFSASSRGIVPGSMASSGIATSCHGLTLIRRSMTVRLKMDPPKALMCLRVALPCEPVRL